MIKVLSFRLQDKLLGIETNYVKEINRNVVYTCVPRAPKKVVGLFNMRGQVVTLFNLSYLLGCEVAHEKQNSTCIILKAAPNSPNQAGFLIERTEDVIDLADELCEEPPANVDAEKYEYIKKVARLENELLMIVDPILITGV